MTHESYAAETLQAPKAKRDTAVLLIGALTAVGLISVMLLAAYVVRQVEGVPGSMLYRDANAIAGQPFYYGMLEYATASIMMMSGAILAYETLKYRRGTSGAAFAALCAFAALTLYLGADDLLMLHESAPYLGLRSEHVMAVSGVVLLLAVLLDPAEFARPRAGLMGMAVLALGLAGIEDVFSVRPLGTGLEDYLEIVGFSFWSVYIVSRAATR